MAEELYNFEAIDGVRMPWNVWPRSKVEALKCVLPFSVLYSPCKATQGLEVRGPSFAFSRPCLPATAAAVTAPRALPPCARPGAPRGEYNQARQRPQVVSYPPVTCKSCTAVVSMYAMIDYSSKMWVCPHCATRNFFPAAYASLSPEQPFPELCRSTIEYVIPQNQQYPPVYVLIVDTAVSEDELDACKSTLKQALELMPENCLVGLVSFGTHVHVHELQASGAGISRLYVFRGTGSFPANTVALQLGFKAAARAKDVNDGFLAYKFLVTLEDAFQARRRRHRWGVDGRASFARVRGCSCDRGRCAQVETALDSLQPDAYPPASDHRKSRCTGTAVQVAAGLAATGLPGGRSPVRLMLFVGGPCTEGPSPSRFCAIPRCQPPHQCVSIVA